MKNPTDDCRGVLNELGRDALRDSILAAVPEIDPNLEFLAAAAAAAGDPEPSLDDMRGNSPDPDPEPQAAPTGNTPEPFAFQIADEIGGVAEPLDFVEGLLTENGASVLYGPSNCGKTFWFLDLAACVATGRHFRDELEVEQGTVVYVCLEGSLGARNRIEALRRAGKLPPGSPLFLCFAPVSLLTPGHAGRLAETVKAAAAQSAIPCKLVIIDTLARAMAGGDENSPRDMTEAVKAIDAVRAATGAHVAIVHHCGKDEARGARGHSSLRGAVDTEIEIFRPDGESVSTVRVTKQRELSPGEPMPFTLKVATLGIDRRGKPITSCTVHHEDSILAATHARAGRKAETTPAKLLELLPMATTSEWQKVAKSELGVSPTVFYKVLEKIKREKLAIRGTTSGWERQ